MRWMLGRLPIGLLVAYSLWLVWPRSPATGRPVSEAPSAKPLVEDHGWSKEADASNKWIGVAGCASTACHHENGPKGSLRSEYSTWAGWDPHSRAFQVLYNDRSVRIARNLYGPEARASEQALCLKCHASHDGVTDHGVSDRFQLADGVGCESCHGAAEKWLTIHYEAGFKEKTLEEKAAFGLRPTKDLLYRAKLCTECHVGTPDKEVNHDLIAAGHPRLAFEFAAFHGIYNKHWNILDDHARYPDFEARAWTVGQLVTARSAIDLLRSRAEGAAAGTKPWPEFSEYDCFACHKQLSVSSPRQEAGYPDRRAGSLPWGSWYLSPTNPINESSSSKSATLASLRKIMQNPVPATEPVRRDSEVLLRKIEERLASSVAEGTLNASQVHSLLERLIQVGDERAPKMSWDEAAQLYLGLAALYNGETDLGVGRNPATKDRLLTISRSLREAFPLGSDSPSGFKPRLFDTDLRAFRTEIGK